ncbi:MAG: TatD family hydrolase [Euryarchaeota archaeon]|nr:TatD family hydrolase [Euryarchaeota archaeon]
MIVTDNHMHLDPKGLGVEAAKEFQRSGGTHLFIIYKHAESYGIEVSRAKDFEKAYDIAIRLCEKVNEETNLTAYSLVGIHPAEIVELYKKFGEEKTWNICVNTLEIIAEKYEEGEIVGIGEVGRPHFPVSKEIVAFCQRVMDRALALSKELDCAIQLHLESFEEKNKFYELEKTVKKYGNEKRVIKHFAPPKINLFREIGIMPSIIASKKNIKRALKEGNRFVMETDYIDDPERPGAVLGPRTVPRRTLSFFKSNVLDENDINKIHRDNIEKIYGISLKNDRKVY